MTLLHSSVWRWTCLCICQLNSLISYTSSLLSLIAQLHLASGHERLISYTSSSRSLIAQLLLASHCIHLVNVRLVRSFHVPCCTTDLSQLDDLSPSSSLLCCHLQLYLKPAVHSSFPCVRGSLSSSVALQCALWCVLGNAVNHLHTGHGA